MLRNSIICSHCGSINHETAVHCVECLRDLRRHSVARAASLYEPSRSISTCIDDADALPPVYFTARSFAKLESLARLELSQGNPLRDFLLSELDRAVVLGPGEVSTDLVEVGDRVVYRTGDSRTPENRRLVYPDDRHPAGDAIPVLSAVGVALLGLKEGSGMAFTMPDGGESRVRVIRVAS